MSLTKCDGLWINLNHVSLIRPVPKLYTQGTVYRIQFKIQPEEYEGNTIFRTEKECQEAIEKIVGE